MVFLLKSRIFDQDRWTDSATGTPRVCDVVMGHSRGRCSVWDMDGNRDHRRCGVCGDRRPPDAKIEETEGLGVVEREREADATIDRHCS